MRSPERSPVADVELSQPALTLANRFVQRWDLYARQLDDGRYVCIHEGLNVRHLFAHLRGEITLGTYLLDADSQARFIVLDADDADSWQRLSYAAQELAQTGAPGYLERSRRGGHLWLFLPNWVPGVEARAFGFGVMARHQLTDIELFPKQDQLGDGPGSLIRMPFGVHRLTQRRYGFRTADSRFIGPSVREQLRVLGAPQTVPSAAFGLYRTRMPSEPVAPVSEALVTAQTLSERIKASVSVLDFVGQYVELKPTKSGAIGLCPFHDDHHPSFGVNAEGNYWHCFAGCGGGSIIDFWMKWRGCGFTEAVRELAGKPRR